MALQGMVEVGCAPDSPGRNQLIFPVEYDDAVTAYGLLACLEALERRIAEQDAALLAYLKAREEKADGD